jgi:hypothetical protein
MTLNAGLLDLNGEGLCISLHLICWLSIKKDADLRSCLHGVNLETEEACGESDKELYLQRLTAV